MAEVKDEVTTADDVPKRRSSIDIVAGAQEMKARTQMASKKGKKDGADDDLMANVKIDHHTKDLEQLLKELGTDPKAGMTAAAADARLLAEGPNKLTPPKTIP